MSRIQVQNIKILTLAAAILAAIAIGGDRQGSDLACAGCDQPDAETPASSLLVKGSSVVAQDGFKGKDT
jgi:hypothetical protein